MNLTRFAIENRTLTNFLVFLVVVGGLYSYFQLGQLEDPDFTVKLRETGPQSKPDNNGESDDKACCSAQEPEQQPLHY